MIYRLIWINLFVWLSLFQVIHAKEITTNSIKMSNAPDWLKRVRVDKVTDRIQMHMEWTIRRINVFWYVKQSDFEKVHSLGPHAIAVARKSDNTIHLGPKVTDEKFDQIFGHELVHIISFQKYKEAIPKWLEEGFASYLSKKGKVDYLWMSKRPFPKDVRELLHPYKGDLNSTHYHYLASQAIVEMLAKKCDLPNLLRLSVERKMEDYITTFCEIKDLNAAFQKWVTEQSKKLKSKKT